MAVLVFHSKELVVDRCHCSEWGWPQLIVECRLTGTFFMISPMVCTKIGGLMLENYDNIYSQQGGWLLEHLLPKAGMWHWHPDVAVEGTIGISELLRVFNLPVASSWHIEEHEEPFLTVPGVQSSAYCGVPEDFKASNLPVILSGHVPGTSSHPQWWRRESKWSHKPPQAKSGSALLVWDCCWNP